MTQFPTVVFSTPEVGSPDYYVFTLYVKDRSAAAQKVYERLAALCFRYLPGKHIIKLVDLSDKRSAIETENILAAPTITLQLPGHIKTFIGDLSNDAALRIAVEKAA